VRRAANARLGRASITRVHDGRNQGRNGGRVNGDRRWWAGVALAAAVALAWGAAGEPTALAEGAGGRIAISIAPGEHWLRGGADAVPESDAERAGEADTEGDGPGEAAEAAGDGPQVAVWLEDPAGRFVSTVYVSRRAAVEDWGGVAGAGEGEDVTARPLPVWAGQHRGVGVEPMASCGACHGKRRSDDKATAGDPILEALSGPTPKEGLSREWRIPDRVEPGTYGIRVEVNHWLDPNERYAAVIPAGQPDASGGSLGSGQPSLVWAGTVEIGADPYEAGLALVGRGHPSGASGEVEADLVGLTTALSIVDTIRVSYAPPQ
jgi:hypothetical protein